MTNFRRRAPASRISTSNSHMHSYLIFIFLLFPFAKGILRDKQTRILQDPTPPGNNECFSLNLLPRGSSLVGSTVGSTTVNAFQPCDTDVNGQQLGDLGAGVWYGVAGHGRRMRVSTCSPVTNLDTNIQIFTGSCASLECLKASAFDSECSHPGGSSVAWDSQLGTIYFFLVSGQNNTEQGTFQISLIELESPVNDECSGSVPAVVNGPSLLGSTTNATASDNLQCGESQAGAVWFTFMGNGGILDISTCSALTDFPTAIQVFQGSCESSTCLARSSSDQRCQFANAATVQIDSILGQQYHVLVLGRDPESMGNFELSVRDGVAPPEPTSFPTSRPAESITTSSPTVSPSGSPSFAPVNPPVGSIATNAPTLPSSPPIVPVSPPTAFPEPLPSTRPFNPPTEAPQTQAPVPVPATASPVAFEPSPPLSQPTLRPTVSPDRSERFRQQLAFQDLLSSVQITEFESIFADQVEMINREVIVNPDSIRPEVEVFNVGQQSRNGNIWAIVEYIIRYVPAAGSTPISSNEIERAIREYQNFMTVPRNLWDFENAIIQQGIPIVPGSLEPSVRQSQPPPSRSIETKNNTGAVVAGTVVGGLLILAISLGILYWYYRIREGRERVKTRSSDTHSKTPIEHTEVALDDEEVNESSPVSISSLTRGLSREIETVDEDTTLFNATVDTEENVHGSVPSTIRFADESEDQKPEDIP